jgi:aminopyrrolnitrin oxygenase
MGELGMDSRSSVVNERAGTAFNLAASWYIALPSAKLKSRPKAITLFGRSLVAWRNRSGRPVIADRACPHMGASLADGKVVDGELRCAFHHWRFDGDGACTAVPGLDRIPRGARLRTYPAVERFGYVWAWYGSREPMFGLPEFPELQRELHFPLGFRFADMTGATPRRIMENTYDPDHLVELHGLDVSGACTMRLVDDPAKLPGNGPRIETDPWFGAELSWPSYAGNLGRVTRLLGTNAKRFVLRVDGWPSGQRITYLADGVPQYKLLLATTPIGPNRTVQHIAVAIAPTGRFLGDLRKYLIHRPEVTFTSNQDIPIFNTIEPGDRHGIYVDGDRGMRGFRKYYQHWVDRVTEDA